MEKQQHTPERVLVTGITGFLGSHVAKLLLEKHYLVRGSVRDKSNERKIRPLAVLPNQKNLELVEADLLQPDTWDQAVRGCDYVIHVASPFPTVDPKNEDEVIQPAVVGTMAVMKACARHKVKHVVLTSSIASVQSLGSSAKPVYTEEDWTDLDTVTPYYKSKAMAERAAWDFYNTLDKATRFRLTAILPGLIFGPALIATDFTSGEIVRQILTGELFAIPRLNLAVVDVRDVAFAHVAAIEKPGTDGQRYICCSEDHFWFEDIAKILREEFGKYGYRVTRRKLKYYQAKLLSIFNSKAHSVVPFWNSYQEFSNTKIIRQFGMAFRPGREAVLAMAYSLIENHVVPDLVKRTKL